MYASALHLSLDSPLQAMGLPRIHPWIRHWFSPRIRLCHGSAGADVPTDLFLSHVQDVLVFRAVDGEGSVRGFQRHFIRRACVKSTQRVSAASRLSQT